MKIKPISKVLRFFKKEDIPGPCSEKEPESINVALDTEGFERCVMCGELTAVPVSMPIDWRENYEIGCGQLCDECAMKLHKTTECENVLTNAQILLAVEQSRNENSN